MDFDTADSMRCSNYDSKWAPVTMPQLCKIHNDRVIVDARSNGKIVISFFFSLISLHANCGECRVCTCSVGVRLVPKGVF